MLFCAASATDGISCRAGGASAADRLALRAGEFKQGEEHWCGSIHFPVCFLFRARPDSVAH
jgi:hypothetical protein